MKRITCRILSVLVTATVIATVSGVASAQSDFFTTNYFSNNTTQGAPAGTLRFSNDGPTGIANSRLVLNGRFQDLCANIYVYGANQQIAECCSCPVTPNGLVEENIKTDLLGNTITKVIPNRGVIQIIATADYGVCDPTLAINFAQGLTAWTTHIENQVGGQFPVSVTQNAPSDLTSTEINILEEDCNAVLTLGSGFGRCRCNAEATD